MSYQIKVLQQKDWPPLLSQIPDPPKKLYFAGHKVPDYSGKFLCVVGSRKFSNYGEEATKYLIEGLKGYPITIVSGLALGIDSITHRAAIKNGLPTISVPGSGLDPKVLHPSSHTRLAEEIIEKGGVLMNEFEPDFKATHYSFPLRNRIMAGMCNATLIIEADEKSGTLITAKLTSDYNRELLALPGSIFSRGTTGPHMFLRLGATLIRDSSDILEALGIKKEEVRSKDYSDCSEREKKIISLLREPMEKDLIFANSGLSISEVQTLLTLLELKGHIKESLGEIRLA